MSSKWSGDGTYSHVRREVGHAIERIVVVGLEGRTPFCRCVGRPALDGGKTVLLERDCRVKPPADCCIETAECRRQGGEGGTVADSFSECSRAFQVEEAEECEEGKQSTARDGHGEALA